MTCSKAVQEHLLHLFERISEPIYVPKTGVFFDLPEKYMPDEVKDDEDFIKSRSTIAGPVNVNMRTDDERKCISVNHVKIPDLSAIKIIPRGVPFCHFSQSHMDAACALIKIFEGFNKTPEVFANAVTLIRDEVNEGIYTYALSLTMINNPVLRSAKLPPVWETFPEKFCENSVISEAHKQSRGIRLDEITVNRKFSANDRIVENRLSYFREDLGINSHHWHWHIVYPHRSEIKRDRRGELFYYMHSQILARYDTERIANLLPRVVPLDNWREPIPEGYYPKLTSGNGAIIWGSRPSGLTLKDVKIPDEGNIEGFTLKISDMECHRSRILEAIHSGYVRKRNENGIIENEMLAEPANGTDILGNIIEASQWSANRRLYGSLHNDGHTLLAYIHDPDRGHQENISVMGDVVTAMRDPVFFRWHKFIDSLFQEFKATLTPYKKDQLILPGIRVADLKVIAREKNESQGSKKDVIETFWEESLIELHRGLDFSSHKAVNAKVTHLQHQSFHYQIQVDNQLGKEKDCVVRLFLAPVKDETGREFSFREQRTLMIEMDKFVLKVQKKMNTYKRESDESSVTIPFEQTFRELEKAIKTTASRDPGDTGVARPKNVDEFVCGCGWPAHMLLPRGNSLENGMEFVLFCMLTDWDADKAVEDENVKVCKRSASYCGILNQKYPDKKPMGYPFDRPAADDIKTLDQFITDNKNMFKTKIRIKFEDKVYPKEG